MLNIKKITMDEKHVNLILVNFEELVDVTHQVDDIIQKLEERKIFNSTMVKYLERFEEQRKRLRNFYEMIMGRGPRAFQNLLLALRETENFRAEKLLTKDNLVTYESASILETPISVNEDVFDGAKSDLKVTVHSESKFMDIDEENQPSGTYKMRSKPRGHALIVNINKTLNLKDRKGSEVDANKLNKLFKDLGYKVFPHINLTLKELQETVVDFSSDPALANVDSSVVFIMSHGQQFKQGDRSVDLVTSDGKNLNTKWIVDQFFSPRSKLTKLGERKPKLFFFQACRVPEDETARKINIRWSSDKNDLETDSVLIANGHMPGRNYEDTFLLFSTIEGYPSMRDKTTGTWFVANLCEVLAENAWQYDLDTMMEMVDEKIRKKSSQFGYQTVEVSKLGVSKKLFFNPGL